MPKLIAVIDSLDGVDAKYHDLYVQDPKDKKFTLQVDGFKTQADVDRVTVGLVKERADHKTAKEALKVATDKLAVFGENADPDEIATKLEKLAQLEAAGANPTAAQIQELVATGVQNKLKQETTKLTREVERLTGELGTANQKAESLNGIIIGRTVDDAMRNAATVAKVNPDAVPDLLLIARSELKLNAEGKVLTEDGRDPAQWLEDRKKVSPYFWPQAKGAGAGGGDNTNLTGKDNPFTRDGWNITKQGQLLNTNPTEATRLAEAAGVPKDATGKIMLGTMPPAPAK